MIQDGLKNPLRYSGYEVKKKHPQKNKKLNKSLFLTPHN